MQVFFEDDGAFKAGTILADNDASLQVENAHGKRMKIKAASVLLRFDAMSPAALLERAQALAGELDPNFLWEVSGDAEFSFTDLAREYYGHIPAPAEAAAVAFTLHAHPMHFYRKGKGRYKAAPPESLKAALASVEKKRGQAEQVAGWVADLAARRLPDALRAKLDMLLYAPDKNTLEWKALAQACDEGRTNALSLLAECGAIASTHDYHFRRFLLASFPHGTGFRDTGVLPALPDLPRADAEAFSIDDASTTEIDDAFSVRFNADGGYRVGVHIAAPALTIARGSPFDALARERLSTVYMPGNKITMLPDQVIAAFSLDAGHARPALSLYLDVTPDGVIVNESSRVESVAIVANLRHDTLDHAFAAGEVGTQPHGRELAALWRLAQRLESARGQSDVHRVDYTFTVEGDPSDDAASRVRIAPRLRGSPLDKLVAELMIHVNSRWGKWLADARVPGLYRTQGAGKVKMSTQPAPHEGLGVAQYLWASSPLRRYADLLNQRQLIAVVAGDKAPYQHGDGELFAAMADFEATYSAYLDFQSQMEHYWCLRWILQEQVQELQATVIRENLVRFDRLPIVIRVTEMPNQAGGAKARIGITRVDLLGAALECRFVGLASDPAGDVVLAQPA
jgi:exoribonuclease-2